MRETYAFAFVHKVAPASQHAIAGAAYACFPHRNLCGANATSQSGHRGHGWWGGWAWIGHWVVGAAVLGLGLACVQNVRKKKLGV